jgi:hypothetical protein
MRIKTYFFLSIFIFFIPKQMFADFCGDYENYLKNRDVSNDILINKEISEGFGFYLMGDINKDTLDTKLDGVDFPYLRSVNNNLIINRVVENSPFHKKDIRHFDILSKVNDLSISEMTDEEFDLFWSGISSNAYENNGEVKFTFILLEKDFYDGEYYYREGFEDTFGIYEVNIKPDKVEWPNDISSILIPIDLIDIRPSKYEYDLEYITMIGFSDETSINFMKDYKLKEPQTCIYTLSKDEDPYMKYNFFNPKINKQGLIVDKSFISHEVKFSFWPETEEYIDYIWVDITERKVSTFSQYFEFHLFPFESHFIETTIAPYYTNFSLNNNINEDANAIYYANKLVYSMFTPNFDIINVDYYVYGDDEFSEKSSVAEEIVTSIEVKRRSFYFVAKIVSPIFLILLLSWSVFFLKPRDIESRLTVSIICFLSLIAYNFVIEDSIPKLAYYTWMDWYVSFSYIFCGLTTFFTIYDYQLISKNKKEFKISEAMRSSGIFIFIFLNILTFYILKFQSEGLI